MLAVGLILIWPLRNLRLAQVESFVPMVDAIMCVGDLITASLLYAQASVFRSRALTVLATGYLLAALLLVPHALTFPGAFSPDGLLGAGLNTPSWLAMFRRAAVPVVVIAYVQIRRREAAAPLGSEHRADETMAWVFAAVAMAVAATFVTTLGRDLLPPLYLNRTDVIHSYAVRYEAVVFILHVGAATLLFRQRSSVLDIWLLAAFSAALIQSLLIMSIQGRFTVGWYWLFVMMLFSNLVVMLALLVESNRLYARLALSMAARTRERETRLMSIDAMAAAISHEVGQPLAAIGANTAAGLNWLTRPRPDVRRAITSLHGASDANGRATDVLKSIRAMFAKRLGVSTEFSLNDLIRETAALLQTELTAERVALQLSLDETMPSIRADRIQIQRVLINLLTNAIESLSATEARPRRIAIRTSPLDGGHDVLIEVSDSGVGFTSEEMEVIFDPFFTTKTTGSGLGLSLCANIVGVHGGRLWASPGEPNGATFHVQLPACRYAAASSFPPPRA